MRFEVLKRSNLKRNIMIGVVVVAIIIVCVITLTRAKYRTVASTTLIKGEVNYTLADLNLVAVYIQQDDESYAQDKEIPESGYTLNTDKSYCEVNGAEDKTISLSYDMSTQTLTVSPMTTRGTKCYLYFDIQGTLLSEVILANNGTPKINPTLDTTSCEDGSNIDADDEPYNDGNCGISENGLYQETVYEGTADEGTTYYFRGTVDNNWVSFAGFYWRIIRINEDGTVRLIYSGEGSPAETGEDTQISTRAFNSSYNRSYYVGYMYTESDDEDEGQHGTDKDSTIKEELDTWYVTNIENKGLTKYIADSGFCGDREVADGYSWASNGKTINYAAYDRRSGTPTFECNNEEDLYTTSTSDKGNRALKYAIGLITMDEVRYAGAYSTTYNYGYWLYTGQYYWTMTPAYFYFGNRANVFPVTSAGAMHYNYVTNTYGVRPVINLSANVTISSGDGTIGNVYIVKTQ